MWLAKLLTELAGGLRKAERVFQRVYQCVSEVQKTAKEQSPPIDAMEATRTEAGAQKAESLVPLWVVHKPVLPPS